jgi:hypothetical protein
MHAWKLDLARVSVLVPNTKRYTDEARNGLHLLWKAQDVWQAQSAVLYDCDSRDPPPPLQIFAIFLEGPCTGTHGVRFTLDI